MHSARCSPLHHSARVVFLLLTVATILAVPTLNLEPLLGERRALTVAVGVSAGFLAMALAHGARRRVRDGAGFLLTKVNEVSERSWLAGVLWLGVALRALWVWAYPAQPSSDAAVYVSLALKLANGEPYAMGATRAFWPPGYPLLLSTWYRLFEPGIVATLLLNLLLYLGTTLVSRKLARLTGENLVVRCTTILLAVWPGFITLAAIPAKELALCLLLPGILLLFLLGRSGGGRSGWGRVALAGALLGFGCLTQPSLVLFAPLLFLFDLVTTRYWRRVVARFAVVSTTAAIVIAPWTIRNLRVLGAFVPIATNGGSVLYRANNPLAHGGYTERAEIDLSPLSEVEENRVGFALAREWILNNPLDFMRLALRKQLLFLGDDSDGVYWTVRRGGLSYAEGEYLFWKATSNAFWLGLWLVAFVFASELKGWHGHNDTWLLMLATFLYLLGLHSIFESQSKYHEPLMGPAAILISSLIVLSDVDPRASTSRQSGAS
jgi:4-amino-4-deoxy-L-arabinose transferase-like glycosyltransferase